MKSIQGEYAIQKDYIYKPGIYSSSKPTETKVTEKDRASLIDFVEELHAIFDLIPETLFIAIQTIDRFLGHKKD